MTPLLGPDQQPYALAQGSLTVGGHEFEAQFNRQQRNYPTTGVLSGGATVEFPVDAQLMKPNGEISFLLDHASFTTAERIAARINNAQGIAIASVRNADEVALRVPGGQAAVPAFVAAIENLPIRPDALDRIVINERTGTIVAGSDVRISSVVISQGDIRVTVRSENYASQPSFIGGFANDVQSLIVTNTELDVEEGSNDAVASFPDTSVGALVQGLARAKVGTRRIVSILQAIKAAGALHADIVVQ